MSHEWYQMSDRWYAIQVRSQAEKMVSLLLKQKGYEAFVPTYVNEALTSQRTHERPLFPGYVFCRVGATVTGLIVTTPGVLRVVGFGKRPEPLPDSEIDNLKRVVAAGVHVRPCPIFKSGEYVRVVDGPLRGCTGVIRQIKSETHLIVSVELLQRSVAAVIDRDCVSEIPRARGHVA